MKYIKIQKKIVEKNREEKIKFPVDKNLELISFFLENTRSQIPNLATCTRKKTNWLNVT